MYRVVQPYPFRYRNLTFSFSKSIFFILIVFRFKLMNSKKCTAFEGSFRKKCFLFFSEIVPFQLFDAHNFQMHIWTNQTQIICYLCFFCCFCWEKKKYKLAHVLAFWSFNKIMAPRFKIFYMIVTFTHINTIQHSSHVCNNFFTYSITLNKEMGTNLSLLFSKKTHFVYFSFEWFQLCRYAKWYQNFPIEKTDDSGT